MDTSPEYAEAAVELAVSAFFASLAQSYPECTSGDITPGDYVSFMAAAERAASAWYHANRQPAEAR